MATHTAFGDSRLSFWRRVREFAVPPSMIETATARRLAGDWAGACAAAGIDVDLAPRSVARTHGRELADRVRADLRRLAPDLLRWHMPRIAPDGLLRPGLTLSLARYDTEGPGGERPAHLVVRTAPAWADAGQRMSLALWDASRPADRASHHPHPCPDRRFRLDLHRHLWDAERAGELGARARGAGPDPGAEPGLVPPDLGCAVGRWADEAGILLAAEGRPGGTVLVRLGGRRRLALEPAAEGDGSGPPGLRITRAPSGGGVSALPVLPDAATWVLPDLELLRTGAIDADLLHPLVAAALVPGRPPVPPPRSDDPAGRARLVECRGARHRIGLVDGVLAPLDHEPEEIRREELLAALTGTPLPCLQAVDRAHRRPDCLDGVRERLSHGDIAGALAVVEGLLGPEAVLRDGALRDALEEAAHRRITYGLFRAGLTGPGPTRNSPQDRRPLHLRSHPRHTTPR
ncbi:hypothetical protein [Streptomyces sp. NBC_00582]|uniref:hypothetical protein n=1 Tax=Streptomyces sp. NBC_00582 TaxID=2975783 RepID=UPI002E802EDB|nr:hypothetical protein [Streptomyces sp. NBC_00582]WUB66493.1 hypothetical protein OG852_41795 [Streptomyces sp. NBC_00582]